jgi:two-component system chemotaxis response regulator CheY
MLTEADFSGLIIQIVDDSGFIRRLTADILQHFGVGTILQADSAEAAFEQISHVRPDLIICDWQMYPTDGMSFLRQLRGHGDRRLAGVPFLMITGHGSDDYVAAAIKAGANSFIVKPYAIGTLMTHLLRVLEDAAKNESCEVWNIA